MCAATRRIGAVLIMMGSALRSAAARFPALRPALDSRPGTPTRTYPSLFSCVRYDDIGEIRLVRSPPARPSKERRLNSDD